MTCTGCEQCDLDAIESRAKAAAEPWQCETGDKLNNRQIAEHVAGMDPATTLALVAAARRLSVLEGDWR